MILASFLVLVAGVYRLGRIAATPLVGAVAAALLLTRFDYPFLAARGYIDIPYMALVVWAAILEAQPPRRGVPVLIAARRWRACCGPRRGSWRRCTGSGWRGRRPGASGSSTPRWPRAARSSWCAVDYLVTGDPMFSLQLHVGARPRTSAASGRSRSCRAAIPHVLPEPRQAAGVRWPPASGAVLGVVISPRRMLMPIVLLVAGLATFIAIGVAGASVIERYLAVPALALMVLAAVAIGGWTMLLPGRLRTGWMVGAVLIVVLGVGYTATRLNLSRFDNELRFRGQAHDDLTEVLNDPKVKAGLRCGPLTGPNHKIVPDARWIAGLGDGDGARARVDRADRAPEADARRRSARARSAPRPRTSRCRSANGRGDRRHQPLRDLQARLADASDDARIQVPPPGFKRVKTTRFYAAYVRC